MPARRDHAAGLSAYVDLFWLPLGAGDTTGLVRRTGWLYATFVAARQRRPRRALYHSALEVGLDRRRYVIEMTPQWGLPPVDRGIVVEGPVGLRALGRSRLFRYEVHRWENGTIPDRSEAVGGARRVSADDDRARRLLDLVSTFPACTWGRDEQRAGQMWNSNSLTSWLLSRSGHHVDGLGSPDHGSAPGWSAGLIVAARADRVSG